jgi:hypothetical protein
VLEEECIKPYYPQATAAKIPSRTLSTAPISAANPKPGVAKELVKEELEPAPVFTYRVTRRLLATPLKILAWLVA